MILKNIRQVGQVEQLHLGNPEGTGSVTEGIVIGSKDGEGTRSHQDSVKARLNGVHSV